VLRTISKRILFGLAWSILSPLVLLTWIEKLVLGPETERVFGACKELLCLVPTPLGVYLRAAYYWSSCVDVSPDAVLNFGTMLAHRNVSIGPRTVVGAFSIIGYSQIGQDVLFGARVSVLSGKYQHGRPEQRSRGNEVGEQFETIRIGRNSWIGQDAVIMADVGCNCTVGAGSVVQRPVVDDITVMGNPARKVSLDAAPSVAARESAGPGSPPPGTPS
jgi:serine acetyltransferase